MTKGELEREQSKYWKAVLSFCEQHIMRNLEEYRRRKRSICSRVRIGNAIGFVIEVGMECRMEKGVEKGIGA